eukprot:2484184-Pyramimonas_sp.AAC.1
MTRLRQRMAWTPQRDSRPDRDPNQKIGLAHVEYRLDRQSKFSAAQTRARVPGPGQLLARTSQHFVTLE